MICIQAAKVRYIILGLMLLRIVNDESGFEITFPDAIPLVELFGIIDHHSSYRGEIQKLKKTLEDRSYQFRVIQKRLLNRFKVSSLRYLPYACLIYRTRTLVP